MLLFTMFQFHQVQLIPSIAWSKVKSHLFQFHQVQLILISIIHYINENRFQFHQVQLILRTIIKGSKLRLVSIPLGTINTHCLCLNNPHFIMFQFHQVQLIHGKLIAYIGMISEFQFHQVQLIQMSSTARFATSPFQFHQVQLILIM